MKTNYNEKLVPNYSLPQLLLSADGKTVDSELIWKEKRRPEIIKLFEENVYGKTPDLHFNSKFKICSIDEKALNGTAIRKEISGVFSTNYSEIDMRMLLYIPKNIKKPVPIWAGLNFRGNQSINSDPAISLCNKWILEDHEKGIFNNKATEKSRGAFASRWPVEKIINHGYGLATIYYGDFCSDYENNFQKSGFSLFLNNKISKPIGNDWGAIGAWAWGLSRAMDYFETDKNIDNKKVAIVGLSRLGKAALWAGAQDNRFALVAAAGSGCGGAAIFRRCFGETIEKINKTFPHWFCDNFKKYNNNENKLPLDQHFLLALIAPRPVYIASAKNDLWADPRGEFLATKHADDAYKLFAKEKHKNVAYHIRNGNHDLTFFDWENFLDFSDKMLL